MLHLIAKTFLFRPELPGQVCLPHFTVSTGLEIHEVPGSLVAQQAGDGEVGSQTAV